MEQGAHRTLPREGAPQEEVGAGVSTADGVRRKRTRAGGMVRGRSRRLRLSAEGEIMCRGWATERATERARLEVAGSRFCPTSCVVFCFSLGGRSRIRQMVERW